MVKMILSGFAQPDNKKAQKIRCNECKILLEQKATAERAVKFMESCIGSILLEVRHPLSAISLYAQVAKYCVTKEHDLSLLKQLNTIKHIAHATDELVSRLFTQIKSLSTHKIDTSKFRVAFIAKDIEELLKVYPIVASEKKLIKIINLENNFTYVGEPTLTRYVLLILLRNAIDAIPLCQDSCRL
jgi:signal transduction histidine kinase